ncbi:MAG: sugar phosphate permease [Paenibacillus sp.]|jgi:sugar phosphate permease|nr:sugar phosphate permease [Paenibacillus sp.]
MRNVTKKVWGYRYVILVVVWLLYIINYFDRLSVLTFLPFIQKDLNLTPVEVGQLASIFFFAYALAQISSGFLADKIGPKKVMGVAIVVFTGITILTGAVRTFGQFIALRIGLGLGEGHHFAPASRVINNWFPMHERGRATSFFSTSFAVAPAIVPILMTFLSVHFFGGAWRPVFYLLAIPGLIGIFLLWFFIADTPKKMLEKNRLSPAEYSHITMELQDQYKVKKENITSNNGSVTEFWKEGSFYLYSLVLFCQTAIYWGVTTWLSSFLVKQHGLNIKEMGLFSSVPYVIAIFSMLFGGWLMDKIFRRMKIVGIIAYLGCIPVLLFMGRVEKGETGLLLIFLLLVGFFVNLNVGSIYAYVQKRYRKEVVGRATGVSNGFAQLGAFISPLIAGYLVKVGADGTQNYSYVFLFFAVLAAVAVLCILFLKEEKAMETSLSYPTENPKAS